MRLQGLGAEPRLRETLFTFPSPGGFLPALRLACWKWVGDRRPRSLQAWVGACFRMHGDTHPPGQGTLTGAQLWTPRPTLSPRGLTTLEKLRPGTMTMGFPKQVEGAPSADSAETKWGNPSPHSRVSRRLWGAGWTLSHNRPLAETLSPRLPPRTPTGWDPDSLQGTWKAPLSRSVLSHISVLTDHWGKLDGARHPLKPQVGCPSKLGSKQPHPSPHVPLWDP